MKVNLGKSVVILGKGPSVRRCTKSFVDSFDEVAICNRPVYEGYEHLISDHADYDFVTNTITVLQYTQEMYEKLGIKKTILTGLRSELRESFSYHGLDPSTGTLAFHFFALNEEYTRVGLVGFDLFEVSKRVYYFEQSQVTKSLQYLFDNGTYDHEMNVLLPSGHNADLTHRYMTETFCNNPSVKYELITDFPFAASANVEVI